MPYLRKYSLRKRKAINRRRARSARRYGMKFRRPITRYNRKRKRFTRSATIGNSIRPMYKRRKTFGTRRSRNFKNKVRNIVANNNTMTFREVNTGGSLSAINNHKYTEWSFLDRGMIEEALLTHRQLVPDATTNEAKLKLSQYGYGTVNPAQDSPDSTLSVKWKVLRATASIKFRNNSTGPAECVFYLIRPKKDHAVTTSPITEITNGLTVNGAGAAAIGDIRYSPYDSALFNQYFTVYKTVRKTLQPGDEHTVTFFSGSFTYNTDLAKYHTTTYHQRKFQKWLLVKHKGVIGTDEVTGSVGRCESVISWEYNTSIKFSATGDQEFHRQTNGTYLPFLENAPLCAHKPAPQVLYPSAKMAYDENNANMPIPVTNPLGVAAINTTNSEITDTNTKLDTANGLLQDIKDNTDQN